MQAWRQAIEARPHLYRLTAYGRWDIDKAVEFFARWAEDESAGVGRPALCRRCGRLLYERYTHQPAASCDLRAPLLAVPSTTTEDCRSALRRCLEEADDD